ncbi:hypothetical protein MJO28_016901 [Puccinia striiformis f. sp. tritici]|nr:hypothetical protein MJO28_016901 [Puccinia striiformis f. sp. tritici]
MTLDLDIHFLDEIYLSEDRSDDAYCILSKFLTRGKSVWCFENQLKLLDHFDSHEDVGQFIYQPSDLELIDNDRASSRYPSRAQVERPSHRNIKAVKFEFGSGSS